MIWQDYSVAFSLFELDVRWYGIAYIIGFFIAIHLGWWIFNHIKNPNKDTKKLTKAQWEDLVFGMFFAGIIGGRMGEFVFYSPETFIQNPLEVFKIWQGGMSIHGGLLGALGFGVYWSRKHLISLLLVVDSVVIPLSIALGLGRITNFLNGELAGIPTNNADWGVVFPQVDQLLRHPTQLYESAGSFILALIMWVVLIKCAKLSTDKNDKKRSNSRRGLLTAIFLCGYGITRFVIEFWKSPDGWQLFGLSTGQWLCLVMIGLAMGIARKQHRSWT